MRKLVLFLFLATVGCSGKPATDGKSDAVGNVPIPAQSEPVSIYTLWNTYAENEVKAASLYGKGPVIFQGNVAKVAIDDGKPCLLFITAPATGNLTGPRQFIRYPTLDDYAAGVVAYLSSESVKESGELKADDAIRFTGQVKGARRDPRAYQGLVVVIEGCVLETGAERRAREAAKKRDKAPPEEKRAEPPKPTFEDEQRAFELLKKARAIARDSPATCIETCDEILQKYPGTKAAAEAAALRKKF